MTDIPVLHRYIHSYFVTASLRLIDESDLLAAAIHFCFALDFFLPIVIVIGIHSRTLQCKFNYRVIGSLGSPSLCPVHYIQNAV